MKGTAIATLAASAGGTLAWLIGLSRAVWPAHPMVATFFITIVCYGAVKAGWEAKAAR